MASVIGLIAVMLAVAGCGAIPKMPVSPRADFVIKSNPVFIADELKMPFRTLGMRGCLPDDFNLSGSTSVADNCAAKVQAGDVSSECNGVPKIAQFCNCLANTYGYVSGSTFDLDALQTHLLSFSNNDDWKNSEKAMMGVCQRMSYAPLNAQQLAVYSYLCLEWKLYADCDNQQEKAGALDDSALLVRAKFLAGDCPQSPSILLDAFGLVTGRTWAECSQKLYAGDDASQRYASESSRVTCLLQDFVTDAGKLDYDSLKSAITGTNLFDGPPTRDLLFLLDDCTGRDSYVPPGARAAKEVTADEFVQCWASRGVFSCTHQEADAVASLVPETCVISV